MTITDPAPDLPAWLAEIRLEPGPPFSTMGLHSLAVDDWLVVDDERDRELAYKAELLERRRSVVFAAEPGSEAASEELLSLIRQWSMAHDLQVTGPHGDEHPLIEAARLVQEDLVVLQRIDGYWVLTAGVVAFPTHWTIGDKVGLPLDGVHAPVAHYETELRDRVDRFHDRLTVDRPAWRRNWFVLPTSELHLPAFGHQLHVVDGIADDGSPMWIRSERQTLRRLPVTDAIVFTIRVQQAPLGVLRARPDLAERMLAATRSWDREKRMYTSTGGVLDELIAWLDAVAASGHGFTRPPIQTRRLPIQSPDAS